MKFSNKYNSERIRSSTLFLTWITALMGFLSSLLLVAAFSLTNILSSWDKSVSGSVTIQVPTYHISGESRVEEAGKDVEKIVSFLQTKAGIKSAAVVSDDKMENLLEPYLGSVSHINQLPLPKLIDVQIMQNSQTNFKTLSDDLKDIAPMAQVDSHQIWMEGLLKITGNLETFVLFMLFILSMTTVFSVAFTSITSLTVQQDTIDLLHLMGERDGKIALDLSCYYASKTFIGSLMGGMLSFPVFWISTFIFKNGTDYVFTSGSLNMEQWIIIALCPVVFSFCSLIASFWVIIKRIKKLA